MNRKKSSRVAIGIFLFLFLAGCAGPPVVREAVKLDMKVPVGKIDGNQFTGIRYPFNVSAPAHWKITTKYPKFMLDLGFEEGGLEESQVFLFNPETQSNVQIDFSPAGRHVTFDQKKIEWLTSAAEGSFREELEKELGKGKKATTSATQPYPLKGVPYSAKSFATYDRKGVKTEQGWVYAFAEPFQIFILYMVLEKEGVNDHQAVKQILDSFEVVEKK